MMELLDLKLIIQTKTIEEAVISSGEWEGGVSGSQKGCGVAVGDRVGRFVSKSSRDFSASTFHTCENKALYRHSLTNVVSNLC